jgi:hypothetical protein
MRSEDVVAAGLRLLWQLDTFFAEMDASRLDEMPCADRKNLHTAFIATAATITAMRPLRKAAAQSRPVRTREHQSRARIEVSCRAKFRTQITSAEAG